MKIKKALIGRKIKDILSTLFYNRKIKINIPIPLISFSFDDAPKTSFINGGEILNIHGIRATYFISLGELDKKSPSGIIAGKDDLNKAVENGHELGCHTYHHLNSWVTPATYFSESILKNREKLKSLFPGYVFETFAYPIERPNPKNKMIAGKIFKCCRSGGQDINIGNSDLNMLKAFFLDGRYKVDNLMYNVDLLIKKNVENRGWLIFSTHDVSDSPTRFGCNTEVLKKIALKAKDSNSLILPISQACDYILKNN